MVNQKTVFLESEGNAWFKRNNQGYVCMTHKVRHHVDNTYTDEVQEWVGLSILRKMGFE